jgi:G:T-mismatch repair DNA endonuclease (very short patch repair protein)
MPIWFICQHPFNPAYKRHIYQCAQVHSLEVEKDELRFRQLCFEFGRTITREWMVELYIGRHYSLPDLHREFGLAYKQSTFLLDYFGIARRSHEDACALPQTVSRRRETCEERYGVSNPSQAPEFKAKKAATFMQHYGVDNIRKSLAYYQRLHQTMLARFGAKSVPNLHGHHKRVMTEQWRRLSPQQRRERVAKAHDGWRRYWASLTEADKEEYARVRTKPFFATYMSGLEKRLAHVLRQMGVRYRHQWWVKRHSYDFLIVGTNILVEVQGDFWHANPESFGPDDILNHPQTPRRAADIWEADRRKKEVAENKGFTVMYLWERDMRAMNDTQLQTSIREMIGPCAEDAA